MPKSLVFIALLTLAAHTLTAQIEIGLTGGLTLYKGDIDVPNQKAFSSTRPAFGLVAKYHLSENFILRGQFLHGKIHASEKNHNEIWRKQRGFAFTSKINEVAVLLEWYFLQQGNWRVYAFGGPGATFFNPQTDYNEPNPYVFTDVNRDAKASYKKVTLSLPAGIGVQYQLPRDFNLSLDIGYRKTFTDYLDGISILGNPNRPDGYFFAGFTLTKSFGGDGRGGGFGSFRQGKNDCYKF